MSARRNEKRTTGKGTEPPPAVVGERRRATWIVALAGLLLALMLGLNLRVPTGGIVQDALLDRDNPYTRWAAEVDRHTDIRQAEPLSLVLSFPQGLDRAGLQQIVELSDTLRQQFPEGQVWSLARNAVDYRVRDGAQGGELSSQPQLSREQLAQPGFDLAAWRARVQADASSLGTLVSPDFRSAQIMVFLPPQVDEIALVRQVGELLEERRIHPLEWLLWKGDIHPSPRHANVSLGGWAVARGLMHHALIGDVLFYSTLGLLLSTVAAALSLGSWRQALQVSGLILASFIVTRGSIAALQGLGVTVAGQPVQERVYFLLVLSALIVSGLSLFLRAFEAFNQQWRADPGAPVALLWQRVRPLRSRFNGVVLIACLNFATLPQIGIRGVMEVGVLSVIGLLGQRLMLAWLQPALHALVGGLPPAEDGAAATRWTRWSRAWQSALRALPQAAFRLLLRLGAWRLAGAALLCGLPVLGAVAVVWHDWRAPEAARLITVQERPIDYLPGTIVDRGRQVLNAPGGAGFARLNFLLPGDLEDPHFIARAAAFQAALQAGSPWPVRSMLDKLAEVAQRSPDVARPLPATRAQAHELQQLMRWDFDDAALADSFWSPQGLVLFVADAADNSRDLRQRAEAALALARRHGLTLLPFGRLHTYHQTDLYISQGKPLNVLSSFPLVLGVAALWLMAMQRRSRQAGASAQGLQLSPWRAAAAMCLPFAFAYAVVVLVMAAAHLPLDQATACATALGINASVDFGLYLLDDYRNALALAPCPAEGDTWAEQHAVHVALHHALAERGEVTVVDALLNAMCFSLLLGSSFVPIQRLGLLLVLLLLACAAGVLVLQAAVLPHCHRRPRPRRAEDKAPADAPAAVAIPSSGPIAQPLQER